MGFDSNSERPRQRGSDGLQKSFFDLSHLGLSVLAKKTAFDLEWPVRAMP